MLKNNEKVWSLHRNISIDTFPSSTNNERLYLKTNSPKNNEAHFHFILLHDIGEYHKLYDSLENSLVKKGREEVAVTRFDLKGHGLSSGTRGAIGSFDEYSQDLKKLIEFLESKYPNSKIILVGKGMGALVAMNLFRIYEFPVKDKVAAMILANPYIKFRYQIPKFALKLLGHLDQFAKGVKFPLKLKGDDLTGDMAKANQFDKDPLISHHPPVKLVHEMIKTAHKLKTASYFMDVPTLFLLSQEDLLADQEKTKVFIKGMPKELASFYEYPKMRHNIFNETKRDKVFKDIYNWIKINL